MKKVVDDSFKIRWIQEFEKLIHRRQHIILYGNIYDHFLWRGAYQNIHHFLKSYFLDNQFDLVVSYDDIEKFKFAKPDMTELFDNLALRRGALETYLPIEESFRQIFGLLSQPKTSVAVTVELGDMLASKSISQGSGRHPLMMLKKSTLEASLIANGALKGFRNTLVILVNELETVPQWFYHKNPFLRRIQVSLPSKDERREFALRFFAPMANGMGGFYEGDRIEVHPPSPEQPSELEVLAEEFADLTEEFQIWDLEALRHTSWQEKIPLETNKIWRLVNFYKFGQREDPWEKLSADKVANAGKELSEMVLGQERAISAVTTMLSSARVGLSMSSNKGPSGKPKGVFFFVGPTGVGKTELAKAMTKLVFGNEEALARFDMSEYREENADQKLIGAPPGYTGYEEGGQLTNRVIDYPYSILLFDEIEKAHPKILDKFLQILEDGRLTDGKGQTAYFSQTAIIFTSNIGASDKTDPQTGNIIREGIMNRVKDGDVFGYEEVKTHFEAEVYWYFTSLIGRAELLSRLGDNIVVFDLLRSQFVSMIGKKLLLKLAEVAAEKYQLILKFQPSVYGVLRKRMGEGDNLLFGGRRIKTVLESLVERPLNIWIFKNFSDTSELAGHTLKVGIKSNGELEVDRV